MVNDKDYQDFKKKLAILIKEYKINYIPVYDQRGEEGKRVMFIDLKQWKEDEILTLHYANIK